MINPTFYEQEFRELWEEVRRRFPHESALDHIEVLFKKTYDDEYFDFTERDAREYKSTHKVLLSFQW